jgi:hypothetical protein
MKINAQLIIDETIEVFEKSGAAELIKHSNSLVDTNTYKKLHPAPLTPTNIVVNPEKFCFEISNWEHAFEPWGKDHAHLPRYGVALVNQTGILRKNDPINGSLTEWNKNNPTSPLLETDCLAPTVIMELPSLQPLSMFSGHWCRSNILKWHIDAKFLPHIDAVIPSPWIRLWASMSPELVLRFYNPSTEELESITFEPGRVYIIDTSLIHDAYATGDNVYQLFLSVLPSAVPLVSSVVLPKPV